MIKRHLFFVIAKFTPPKCLYMIVEPKKHMIKEVTTTMIETSKRLNTFYFDKWGDRRNVRSSRGSLYDIFRPIFF